MSEHLKKHQPSMTIDEQIENLKEKGLVIQDEEGKTGDGSLSL